MCITTLYPPLAQSSPPTESSRDQKSNFSIDKQDVRCPRCGGWAKRHFDSINNQPTATTECDACGYLLKMNIVTGKVIDSDSPVYRHNN